MDGPSVAAPSDDSTKAASLSRLVRAPSAKAVLRHTAPVFDLELLEARRHIAALEIERAGANRALNDLIVRSWQLEGKLAEAVNALALSDRRFLDHVRAEIGRVRLENAALHARLHVLETSRWWRFEMRVRRVVGTLLKRSQAH